MLRAEVLELLHNGESSTIEFKRDDIAPQDAAKAMVALANARGGRLLLGVEDDGSVTGLARPDIDEWVVTIGRDKIRPPLVPIVELVRDVWPGRDVAVVTIDPGYAVHARWHNGALTYYLRVGRQSRQASTEEQGRLQQQRGDVRAELRPVPGLPAGRLDRQRLTHYFSAIRQQPVPEDDAGWERLLLNTDFAVQGVQGPVASLAGAVLFAEDIGRLLPFAGVDCAAVPGRVKDYAVRERLTVRAPIAPLPGDLGRVDPSLIEQVLAFVRRNTAPTATVGDDGRRVERPSYPDNVVRETVVNAVVHRDYSLTATDVEVTIYDDRLEVVSPGRLPNGVTPDAMRDGVRASRNQLLKDTMRDLGFVDHMGLGVPRKIIAGMKRHNGTEPDLLEMEERFLVRLWS